jgi:transglutaminase-like putative cysteine protease
MATISLWATPQSVKSYARFSDKYDGQQAVVLKNYRTINITETSTGLKITEKVYLEKMLIGKNENDIEDDYVSFNSFSSISDLNAYTYSPAGNSWQKYRAYNIHDFSSMGEFFYNDNFFRVVSFPNVKQGCRTILSYSKNYTEPYLWGTQPLTQGEVVDDGRITVIYPKNVALNIFTNNIDSSAFQYSLKSKGKNNVATWNYQLSKPYDKGDLPSFYTLPLLLIHIAEVQKTDTTLYYLKDNEHLANWYFSNFLKAGNKPDSSIANIVDSLTRGIDNNLEKTMALFNWVRTKIRYIGVEDGYNGFIPRSSDFIFRQRYGDCKDKSNLLIEMLKQANIKAYPAFTGSTDLPFDHDSIVSPIVDNHVIVAVDTGVGELLFLDPTQSEYIPGLPPWALQGKSALVVTDTFKYIVHHFPIPSPEKNTLTQNITVNVNDRNMTQFTRVEGTGYFYYHLKNMMFESAIDKQSSAAETVSYGDTHEFIPDNISDVTFNDNDATIEYSLFSHNASPLTHSKSGTFINLGPVSFFSLDDYKTLESKKGYFFKYPAHWLFNFELILNEDQTIEKLPSDFSLVKEGYEFKINYFREENKVVVASDLIISDLYIPIEKMDNFLDFMKQINKQLGSSLLISTKK